MRKSTMGARWILRICLLGISADVHAVNLYLRSDCSTCTYNSSTSQTLQSEAGTDRAAIAFYATTNAFSFYSAPLTNSVYIAAGKKAGGTIGVQNNGIADFQFEGSEIIYDYDPTTGNQVQIVATTTSDWVTAGKNGNTGQVILPQARVGGTGYTILSGHFLETAITVSVNVSSGINGALIYNASGGDGESFVQFPHDNGIVWPFGNFTTRTRASAPQLSCASISVNSGNQFIVSWPTTTNQTYQLECTTNLSAAAWTPLGNPLAGTGATMAVTNNMNGIPQCFFRVELP